MHEVSMTATATRGVKLSHIQGFFIYILSKDCPDESQKDGQLDDGLVSPPGNLVWHRGVAQARRGAKHDQDQNGRLFWIRLGKAWHSQM